ncbi:MAG: metabolite traffic protein EboE [Pseudonocardiaceae bacterium]
MTSLCYGTNVHTAQDLPGVLAQLDRYAEPVRRHLGWDRLGLGLWLAADVAHGLATDRDALRRLRRELDARGLEVTTLNAFPYRGFHDAVVKRAVYRPHWAQASRLRFTRDCAVVLAALLPAEASYGSISTLPLGWRHPWSEVSSAAATAALAELVALLRALPRPVRLAVEPEPGCVLDTVDDAVRWLAGRVDPEYVGLCLDTCHLAVSFADPRAALAQIARAGLAVVKVQASAALQVADPSGAAARAALAEFTEPRYLHQVRELRADGVVLAADDLPARELPGHGPWRVHYHVPLHWQPGPDEPIQPTGDVLREVLETVDCPHIEVETYTWDVLPPAQRPRSDADLVAGIAAELAATRELLALGRAGVRR